MRKGSLTLLICSLIILITSVFIWLDAYKQNELIRNTKISNIESACYEKMVFYKALLDFFACEKHLQLDDFESFFNFESVLYLQRVYIDDFEFKTVLNSTEGLDSICFDDVLQLKSTSIFFLFNKRKFIKTIDGCKQSEIVVENYIRAKGNFETEDTQLNFE